MAGKAKKNGIKRVLKRVLKKSTKRRTGRMLGRDLVQGVTKLPSTAHGGNSSGRDVRAALRALDATHPSHLALPRAVGPYIPIRTTAIVNTSSVFGFACPIAQEWTGTPGARNMEAWTEISWVEAVNSTLAVSATNNMRYHGYPGLTELGAAAQVVPAALTVQVMCPTAVSAAAGILYIGRSHTQFNVAGSSRTWDQFATDCVSFMAPRLCSAGKLALRGVKCSSYPLDMTDFADFRDLGAAITTPTAVTWDSATGLCPQAMAPIFIYNPNGASLQLLITTEWRARFDIDNPASSGHKFYPPTPDGVLSDVYRMSIQMGHGVKDIVEDVAQIGADIKADL